jgi:hypothetical protein
MRKGESKRQVRLANNFSSQHSKLLLLPHVCRVPSIVCILFQLAEDEHLLKLLSSCVDLMEQGYDDKVRRMLSKHKYVAASL